jgi:hypothetical protein
MARSSVNIFMKEKIQYEGFGAVTVKLAIDIA